MKSGENSLFSLRIGVIFLVVIIKIPDSGIVQFRLYIMGCIWVAVVNTFSHFLTFSAGEITKVSDLGVIILAMICAPIYVFPTPISPEIKAVLLSNELCCLNAFVISSAIVCCFPKSSIMFIISFLMIVQANIRLIIKQY